MKCTSVSPAHDIAIMTGDDAVAWAAAEIDLGRSSDSLILLASLPKPTTWRNVMELFRKAYADLGYDKLTAEEHLP